MSKYTIKMGGPGTIVYKANQIRLPATIHKATDRDVKTLRVMAQANNVTFEVLEQESERLAAVAEKLHDGKVDLEDFDIDKTETDIEELFEGEDTLGDMLKKLEEKE